MSNTTNIDLEKFCDDLVSGPINKRFDRAKNISDFLAMPGRAAALYILGDLLRYGLKDTKFTNISQYIGYCSILAVLYGLASLMVAALLCIPGKLLWVLIQRDAQVSGWRLIVHGVIVFIGAVAITILMGALWGAVLVDATPGLRKILG